jgi:hypothetical protein
MPPPETKYYLYWVHWQQQDGFLLWQNPPEPAREAIWADEHGVVPLFKTPAELAVFAQQRGYVLIIELPQLLNLDAVAEWLNTHKTRPPHESLAAWCLFDDVSAGVGEPFAGNYKTPLRNQVFDLLYTDSGPWRRPAEVHWPPAAQALLRDILTQGFELWQKHACWQA